MFADDLAPLLDRNLAGDDRRNTLMTVFEDFEGISLLGLGERRQAPVVQDQELDAGETFEQASIAAVAAGARQRLEQARKPMVYHASAVPQAFWPRAQAIQLLPTPVGPVIKSPSARLIQSPATSLWNRARSMPRGVRRSTSSTTAFCRSAANLRRVAKRLVSRWPPRDRPSGRSVPRRRERRYPTIGAGHRRL